MTDLVTDLCCAFERLHDSGRLGLLLDEVIAAQAKASPSRGQIAAMVVAGAAANSAVDMPNMTTVRWAVELADDLLAELARTAPQTDPKPAVARDACGGQFAGPWYQVHDWWHRQYELADGRQFIASVDPTGEWGISGKQDHPFATGSNREVEQAKRDVDSWVVDQAKATEASR